MGPDNPFVKKAQQRRQNPFKAKVEQKTKRPGSKKVQLSASASSKLAVLSQLGYCQFKVGDHFEIINNRTLTTVDEGPYKQFQAQSIATEMNDVVKQKEITILRNAGVV